MLAAPAEAVGFPGPAAEAGQAAAPGSAESPAAYSGTGAGPAGTPGGSLPLAGKRHVVRPQAGLPEAWGLGREKSDALTADTPHAHLPTHSPGSVDVCSDTWLSWTEPCSGSGLPGIPCQGSYLVLKHRTPAASLLHAQPWQEIGEAHPSTHVQPFVESLSWLVPQPKGFWGQLLPP